MRSARPRKLARACVETSSGTTRCCGSSMCSSSSRTSVTLRSRLSLKEEERRAKSRTRPCGVRAAASNAVGGSFEDFGAYDRDYSQPSTFYAGSNSDAAVPASSLEEQVAIENFEADGVRVWVLREDREDSDRATFIAAEIAVNATVNEVWEVVRRYDKYEDIFQNILSCSITRRSDKDKLFVSLNLGMQTIYWKVEASTKLHVEEDGEDMFAGKQIRFSQFEGDFESFGGRWVVEPSDDTTNPYKSVLRLELEVDSKATLPFAMTSHIIRQIPQNVKSLAKYAQRTSMKNMRSNVPFADQAMRDARVQVPGTTPFDDIRRVWQAQKESVKESTVSTPYQYLGVSEIPLPPETTYDSNATVSSDSIQGQGRGETSAFVEPGTSSYPEIKLGDKAEDVSDVEIHLRKLDDEEYVHNRVVASVEIEASKEKIWDTLTDYDNLPTILPNLVLSQKIETKSRTKDLPGRVRLRQVVFKEFMYLCFRAEALLDVLEKPQNEIQFQLRNGTFDKLQGKFLLQTAYDNDQNKIEGRTNLVYAVEIRIPRGIQTYAVAPLVEKFAFEDVANNMSILRSYIENTTEEEPNLSDYVRPPVSVLCSDFEVFKAELIRTFGKENEMMPKKGEFRKVGRFDLEKACYAHGGFGTVAERVGWKMQYRRKPRDYWNYENMVAEILAFIEEQNLDPEEFPPRRTFVDNNRMDIVRAYTKFGGPSEVASTMGLRLEGSKQPAWEEFKKKVGEETGLEGEELVREARKRYWYN